MDDETIGHIANLLQEYQDLIPTKFTKMKGIIGDLGAIRIPLKADAKPRNERFFHLVGLEEDCFLARFHQQVQKAREKSWPDTHIKNKIFKVGDLVLLYDSKFTKFPGKFCIHWLGPY